MKLEKDHGFLVAAHRGDKNNSFENTMPAFKMAIEKGSDMIETDVRLTKDGVLVLCHDESLKRTGGVDILIKDLTYDELQQYNVGGDELFCNVPLLEDLLKLLVKEDIMLNLEIKEYNRNGNDDRCRECIEKCVEMIEKYNLGDNMVFNSFDAYVLEYIDEKYNGKYLLHGFYPYERMFNVTRNPEDYLYCACNYSDREKESYDYLIEKNIEPWIGAGVKEKDHLEECISYGARLITTNDPADVFAKLKDIQK